MQGHFTKLYDQSFAVQAVRLWNALPIKIRACLMLIGRANNKLTQEDSTSTVSPKHLSSLKNEIIDMPTLIEIGAALKSWKRNRQTYRVTFECVILVWSMDYFRLHNENNLHSEERIPVTKVKHRYVDFDWYCY